MNNPQRVAPWQIRALVVGIVVFFYPLLLIAMGVPSWITILALALGSGLALASGYLVLGALGCMYLGCYVATHALPRNGGAQDGLLRHLPFFALLTHYFPHTLLFDHDGGSASPARGDFDGDHRYIFAMHPHTQINFGFLFTFIYEGPGSLYDTLRGVLRTRAVAHSKLFAMPILRDILLQFGIVDASYEGMHAALARGDSLSLFPGGFRETPLGDKKCPVLLLKERRGFVRTALQHGARLVPVFIFGEHDFFDAIPNPPWFKNLSKFTNIHMQLTKNVIPYGAPVATVIGRPIDLPTISEPTDADLDVWHARYVQALLGLYERYRGRFGYQELELR